MLSQEFREEIIPKNILMIGPTGVGKTEIARRLSKLVDAPFVKVEATKFTEVGYVGKDVDSIIQDLVNTAVNNLKHKLATDNKEKIYRQVEDVVLTKLFPESENALTQENYTMLREGKFDDVEITLEVPPNFTFKTEAAPPNPGDVINQLLSNLNEMTQRGQKAQKMPVKTAMQTLVKMYQDKEGDNASLVKTALLNAQEDGIVFIDEIDKVCKHSGVLTNTDASDEGVQRDLLPLIEGTIVNTKQGSVDTSKILFICSGAFHECKPSDLIAELQGRLPVRVELKPLSEADLHRILTEPEFNLLQQQVELMQVEKVSLEFTEAARKRMAAIASEVNLTVENIGARRLHTIVEKVVEDISFDCGETLGREFVIDAAYVDKKVEPLLRQSDLTRYVL